MRAKLLLDGGKPKVGRDELAKVVEGAGLEVDGRKADIGIVVGGDGIFGLFGRIETLPLLFVGVRSRTSIGSKAYLAAAYFDELQAVLGEIVRGRYTVQEYRRLRVKKSGRDLGEVFTDVYLQRGAESNCLRYRVSVTGEGVSIVESVIGDGVVVSTAPGATGYYSYPDKIRDGTVEPTAHSSIRSDEIGICHVVPTFTERHGASEHPFRYTVPWGCSVELSITRPADARLYGVGPKREGERVGTRDRIQILPSDHSTKVIALIS